MGLSPGKFDLLSFCPDELFIFGQQFLRLVCASHFLALLVCDKVFLFFLFSFLFLFPFFCAPGWSRGDDGMWT